MFGFSLWMVTWVSWPHHERLGAPALALPAGRPLGARPGPLPFAGLAALVALQFFGGHPESSFHVLVFAIALLGRCGWSRSPAARGAEWSGAALAFGGALVAGAALAAVALIPFVELLSTRSTSSARRRSDTSHQPRSYLLGMFLHDYWGRGTRIAARVPVRHAGARATTWAR